MKRNGSDWMVMKGMNPHCAKGFVVWQMSGTTLEVEVGNRVGKRGRGSERMKV